MRWLLDTNVLIAASKQHPAVVARIREHTIGELLLSSVVWAEIEYGIFKSHRREHDRRVFESIAEYLEMHPFSSKAAHCFGEIRIDLERQGTPIGPYDLMIAAEALAQQAILVTNNTREFSRVQGLTLENWLAS